MDIAASEIDVTSRMGTKNFENCQLEASQKEVAEETILHHEEVMDKAMARQPVEEL